MTAHPPAYAFVLAIIAGFIVLFIPNAGLFYSALAYLLAGSLFGFLWPVKSWRWGLWIAGPVVALLGLSVLFAGQLDVFLKKDLPPLLTALAAACLGSFMASHFKRKQQAGL